MAFSDTLWKVLCTIPVVFGVWVGCVLLCSIPWFQRQIFYAHNIPIWLGQKLDKPETFGFLKNQVTRLHIPTSDGETLYAWLVAPLKIYARHEDLFQAGTEGEELTGLKLLKHDPKSRLVIYFHGNAGTVGQTRRTDAYRMVSSGASENIFVLAFDYRGFGKSTGSPTEEGLIIDAISVINWAMDTAKVSPDRIVLVAQSLGTGLASGAAAHFASSEPQIEFAGLVLCAAFTEASAVILNFSYKGWLPLFAPLKISPWLRSWFSRQIRDTWKTSDRLVALVKRSHRLRLTLVHAVSDEIIPWRNCNDLFFATVNTASHNRLTRSEIDESKESVNMAEGGWANTWIEGDIVIRQNVVLHGGHNGIMKWAPVALATLKTFELD